MKSRAIAVAIWLLVGFCGALCGACGLVLENLSYLIPGGIILGFAIGVMASHLADAQKEEKWERP